MSRDDSPSTEDASISRPPSPDAAGARKASQTALIVGIIGIVLGVLFFFILLIAAASADTYSY